MRGALECAVEGIGDGEKGGGFDNELILWVFELREEGITAWYYFHNKDPVIVLCTGLSIFCSGKW